MTGKQSDTRVKCDGRRHLLLFCSCFKWCSYLLHMFKSLYVREWGGNSKTHFHVSQSIKTQTALKTTTVDSHFSDKQKPSIWLCVDKWMQRYCQIILSEIRVERDVAHLFSWWNLFIFYRCTPKSHFSVSWEYTAKLMRTWCSSLSCRIQYNYCRWNRLII